MQNPQQKPPEDPLTEYRRLMAALAANKKAVEDAAKAEDPSVAEFRRLMSGPKPDATAITNATIQGAPEPFDAPYVYDGPMFQDDPMGAMKRMGQDVLSAAMVMPRVVMPGSEAVQAKLRSLVRGQTYPEALADMREGVRQLPPGVAFASQALPVIASLGTGAARGTLGNLFARGMAPVAKAAAPAINSPVVQGLLRATNTVLPSPVGRTGAAYAGAMRLGRADPEPLAERLAGTATALPLGYGLGLGAEYLAAAVKGRAAPSRDANVSARNQARDVQGNIDFPEFRQLGDLGPTPALADIFNLPVVRRANRTVRAESPRLQNLPDTHAEILDAVRKRLGNKAFRSANGFETGEAVASLDAAIEQAALARGGSYENAIAPYRVASAGADAVEKGADFVNSGASASPVVGGGPASYKAWFDAATPFERSSAVEGVKGEIGAQPLLRRVLGVLPAPSRQLQSGVRLLRESGEPLVSPGLSQFFNKPLGRTPPPGAASASAKITPADPFRPSARASMAQPSALPAAPGQSLFGNEQPPQLSAMTPRTAADANFNRPAGLLGPGPKEGYPTMRMQMEGNPALGPEIQTGSPAEQLREAIRYARERQLVALREALGFGRNPK